MYNLFEHYNCINAINRFQQNIKFGLFKKKNYLSYLIIPTRESAQLTIGQIKISLFTLERQNPCVCTKSQLRMDSVIRSVSQRINIYM